MKKSICLVLLLAAVVIALSPTFSHAQLWERTSGPSGALIRDIQFDSAGWAYVLTDNLSQFYRSSDDGGSWQQLPQVPSEMKTLPNGDLLASLQGRLQVSKDHGASWIVIGGAGSFAITTQGDIYLNGTTFLRSTDEGSSWITLPSPPIEGKLYAFYTPTIFLLGASQTNNLLYRSTDRGKSWSKVVNNLGVVSFSPFFESLAANREGIVFQEESYRSSDDGRTWSRLGDPGTRASVAINTHGVIAVAAYSALTFLRLDGTLINRSSAVPINFGNPTQTNIVLRASPSGSFWHAYGPVITVYTPDDSQVVVRELSLPSGSVRNLLSLGQGSLLALSAAQHYGPYDLYLGTQKGNFWSAFRESTVESLLQLDSSRGILAVHGGTVIRSTDNGTSFTHLGSQLTTGFINALVVDPHGIIYAGTTEGIFRSTDRGGSWDQLNFGLSEMNVHSLTVNPAGDVFAGTNSMIFKSSDHAISWNALPFSTTDTLGITSMTVNTAGDILAANNGVYWSHDGGNTWASIGDGLRGKVNTMLSTPSGHVFAGTSRGIYYLAAGGGQWVDASADVQGFAVLSITRDASGIVYIGSDGGGVYRSLQRYSIAGGAFVTEQTVGSSRVYPNPATHVTYVKLDGAATSVQIVDMLGRYVRSITVDHSGQTLPIDLTELPRGAYQVVIQTPDGVYSQLLTVQ